MKIHEILDRDPRRNSLANGGQARIVTTADTRSIEELRAELETFVCDGQYGDALERILNSFLAQLAQPRQNAAWVSGFFGSGKSHLLKMLGHLWVNTEFEDGATARSLVRGLPEDVVAVFRELDTQVARSGRPAVAAAGTLPAGSGDHVRLTVLSVVLRACGLPEQYAQAQFCFWLREQGFLDRVTAAVASAGKDWFRELNNLYVSGTIANAVLACDPHFARDEKEARQVLRERFPNRTSDITTSEFLVAVREALATRGPLPITILVLDEAQQYIADSTDRAVTLTELAEAVQTQLDSRVMLVMSGQSALSGTPLLQKLNDRFRIAVQLSDTDVEAVTRKVLLHKKPSAVESIRATLQRNAGEVSKHLTGTRLAERPDDREFALEDYPLLPTRRRFWEECFRVVDAAGTQSQLRSQLRILHDALRGIADEDVGAVIPGDALFDAIAPDMVNTGVLLNELASRIQELDDGTDTGRLRRRICGLVFLISRLPREAAIDTGVRATARTVADLMVTDLGSDSGPFRKRIETELELLADNGTLMKVGEEYRLQTTQGAEWDRAYREKLGALRSQIPEVQAKQDQLLAGAVQQVVGGVRLKQGASKVPRSLVLHARNDAPTGDGDQIVVWTRDGSSTAQKDVEGEARRRGQEDPVLHVFLGKPDDDLKTRIIEAEAARLVLDAKGIPSEPAEAREAYESMRSRRLVAEAARDERIRELVTAAKVYQGGGNEVFGESLRQKLDTAAEASLARLFPRFLEGDHAAWGVAMKRARDGSDQPLLAVSWDRATEDHPVVRQTLTEVGSGAKGAEVRRKLKMSPYGWPQDAMDAALIVLHRIGSLRATLNGQPLASGQLDQAKISSTEFRPEKVRIGTGEKIALRSLYQKAGVPVKAGEEETKAAAFVDALLALARGAGGEAPLPACPSSGKVDEIRRLAGSEQLGAILAAREELEAAIESWSARRLRVEQRLPLWKRLQELLGFAASLSVLSEVRPEVESICSSRSLLDDTDYVSPLRKTVEHALRTELNRRHAECVRIFGREMAALAASENWHKLSRQQQDAIATTNRLEAIPDLSAGDEAQLVRALSVRSLYGWTELAEGLPTRFAKARTDAARELEPKIQNVTLRSPTLRSEADIRAWLSETEIDLLGRLAQGPIVIG